MKYFFLLMTTFLTGFYSKAQDDIWTGLDKGKYSVGFQSTVSFDYSQNYPLCIDSAAGLKKYPKPLIINIWYPAINTNTPARMPRSGYLQLQSQDNKILNWIKKYVQYTEDALIDELFRKDKAKLDSVEKSLYASFMQYPTWATRNAKAADGKFPLIIYCQGSGGTIEDNSVLCEMLASHGYVVIGSSFQSNDDEYLGPGSVAKSTRDISFLLSFAQTLSYVDWMHSAFAGHSLGAQKANYFAAQGAMPFDAMIGLETTQEYYTQKDIRWDYFVPEVMKNSDYVKTEFLFATNPPAIHELADKMKNSNRYYLTIPNISHNDFISQGIQRKYLLYQKNKKSDAGLIYDLAKEKYIKLCNYLLSFLNAKLKNNPAVWNDLNRNDFLKMGHDFFIEKMPAGKSTDTYNSTENAIPTPRQLKFLILAGHVDTAVQLLNKFWEKDSIAPVYDATFSFAMIDYLISVDTVKAIQLYKAYQNILGDSAVNNEFIKLARAYRSLKSISDVYANKLYALNPSGKDSIQMLLDKALKK
jgi:hypothetical protein